MPNKPLVFIDVETTGSSYFSDRVIEVGAIRVEKNEIVSSFQTLINPHMHLPPEITRLTGIVPQDLEMAPTFNQIKHEFFELIDGATFVAHNSSFDYGFIKAEFKRNGINYTNRHLCTVKVSRSLFPQERRHNLDAVIKRCGFTCTNRHRAMGDAHVLWQFWQFIHEQFDRDTIEAVIHKILKTPSLPSSISPETIKTLPETPGVYLFYNLEGAPLYIGKSVNLKERILSHFAAGSTSTRERNIATSIHSLETIPTAGDLHAQLLESHLIKSMQPIYNRQLRHARTLLTLTQDINNNGYYTVQVTDTQPESLTPHLSLGIFRSPSQAKNRLSELCEKFELCPKLLKLEAGSGACFDYHLGKCHGACCGKENFLKYNLRFIAAFTPLKLKRWPFPGAITIYEQFDELEAIHTISDWQLIETKTNSNFTSHLALRTSNQFNYDAYKILVRYLLNPRHQKYVTLLT